MAVLEKLAYSISGVMEAADTGRSKLYEEIASGRLKAKKLGRRTIITTEALSDWLAALPDADEEARAKYRPQKREGDTAA